MERCNMDNTKRCSAKCDCYFLCQQIKRAEEIAKESPIWHLLLDAEKIEAVEYIRAYV